MKHIIILVCIAGIMHINAFAQPTLKAQKTLGGNDNDQLFSVCLTTDSGMIAGGRSYSNISGDKTENSRGGIDYWVVKMNKQGKIQWQRTIGGNADDYLKSVIQTNDGGYLLVGESSSTVSGEKTENTRGGADYWIVKLNSSGKIQWNKTYGGNAAEYLDNAVQTPDGGYFLAGSSESNISGNKSENGRGAFDYWIVRLDKHGNKIWDKTIGGSGYEFCSPIKLTTDGGIIAGGFSESYISGEKTENSRGWYDYWLVKLDRKGRIQWDKTIGGSDNDFGRGLQQTQDGGYMMTGSSYSGISGDKTGYSRGGADYWVVKLDGKGNLQWDNTIGGDADDNEEWCLEKTSDGGYIFGGYSASGISGEKTEASRGGRDYWIIKLDSTGNMQWDKTLGGNADDELLSIKETEKNVYAAGGYSYSGVSGDKTEESRGSADYWIAILNDANNDAITNTATENTDNRVTLKKTSDPAFKVYPNPANQILNVRINGKAVVSISDQSGKILLTQTIEGSGSINVSKFSAGIYYLKNNNDGTSQKVIIVK